LSLEFIRIVRNSVRLYLTGNRKYIGQTEQQEWFKSVDHEALRLFLFYTEGEPAGYGIIRLEGMRVLLTGALLEEYRGKGCGRILFDTLTTQALFDYGAADLDVSAHNMRAYNLYHSIGFRATDRKDDIISMSYVA
jgi:ribosomal protein S18 acetylase RimI-like enzyme